MLAITHLVVSLLLIQVMCLDRNDSFVAMLFGVAIDADHLLGLRQYVESNGFLAAFDLHSLMNPGGQWKSVLHSPVAAFVVGPMSIASRLAVPLIFWGVHLGMDASEDILGLFSLPEAVLMVASVAAIVGLRFRGFAASRVGGGWQSYLTSEARTLRRLFRLPH
jgi:hypothetical protein